MRHALALVLALSLAVIARHLGDGEGRFATMALGLVLIVAALVGEACEHIRLPRLTGYLLVGVCFGPSVANLVTPTMAGQLRLVDGLATALIAFGAGMELDLAGLRGEWRSILRHGLWLIGLLFTGLFVLVLGATRFLPFAIGAPWPERFAIALVVAAYLAAFSPTVAMAVLSETRAHGPLAERVLRIVILGDLGVILLFTCAIAGAHALDGAHVAIGTLLIHVSWEISGSIVIGLAVGVGVWAYRRFVDEQTSLVLAGVCLVLAEIGMRAGLSPLLCCLAAGFVARNAAPEAAHEMDGLLERVRLPVLVVFFAAAGASLDIHALRALAPVVFGFSLARGVLIFVTNRFAARKAGLPDAIARYVPYGLISQAGVALGLAVIVGREFGAWGKALETIFIAVISIHELIGPIAFRWALQRLGEIPAEEGAEAVVAPAG